jgi:hypothetical protein
LLLSNTMYGSVAMVICTSFATNACTAGVCNGNNMLSKTTSTVSRYNFDTNLFSTYMTPP